MSNEYGIDFKNLKCSKLKELCISKNGIQTGPFGSQLHNEDYVEIGTPIITVEHLGENFIFHENTPKVSKEDAERLNKYTMQQGDIIFSRVGSVDRRAIVSEKETGWLFSGRCLRVRPNPECLDSEYLSYFFGLSGFKSYIRNIAVGATMPSINTKILSEVPIYYPELPVQKQIAGHLKALDDKIRLNTQTNRTLEHIAQALFKSWFIDFDPVKAKAAVLAEGGSPQAAERAAMRAISGKNDAELDEMQQTQAEAYRQLAVTAALFPYEIENSELGEIPKGWDIRALDQIAYYQNGLALQKFRPENEADFLPVVKIAQLKQGYADNTEKASPNINPKCIIDNGDIVFSWSGSLVVDIWCGGRAALNQHLFKVTSQNYPKWFYYLYTRHHLAEFQRIAADKAVTMGHIKREHLAQAKCVVPQDDFFHVVSIFENLLEEIINQRLENSTLSETRDTLLPQLLSGSLPLPDEAV